MPPDFITLEQANFIVKKHAARLIDKWEKTKPFNGVKSDIDRMAVIIESQSKQIYIDDMTPEEQEFSEAMLVIANSRKVD